MKKIAFGLLTILFVFTTGLLAGRYWNTINEPTSLLNPLVDQEEIDPPLPFLEYTIENLRNYNFKHRTITLEEVIAEYPDYTAYKFTYDPLGKKMSGQINIPNELPNETKVIVMVRGWAPKATYYTGMGSKNAAGVFAQNGYITLAPDFFGYADSEPEPENSWLARFQKPLVVIELIKSIENVGIPITPETDYLETTSDIGIWAHSNGGQITLTALEILSEPYPATLWAPVVAPFPYSVLFFSDEHSDEGKNFRQYVANFEKDYDVFDFSLTQHLNLLRAPFQLHHGTADTSAPSVWSDEFFKKVAAENSRREKLREKIANLEAQQATVSADSASALQEEIKEIKTANILDPITYEYFKYPGADHNLVPSWDTAVQRDLAFFAEQL